MHKAEELGYHPQVILAGRAINDSMPEYVALMVIKGLNDVGKVIRGSKVLIDFFTKNRVKTARRVGFCLFPRPKVQQRGAQFSNAEQRRCHQTFVKSLRVRNALRMGLQLLVRSSAKGNAERYRSIGDDGWCDCDCGAWPAIPAQPHTPHSWFYLSNF